MYMYIKDEQIISLQLLIILNLTNIFMMFFLLFIFMEKRQRPIIHNQLPLDLDHIRTFEINFSDICTQVYSDDFPYNEICSICLELFDDSNIDVVKTINCDHYFHEQCIKRWLRIRTTCPNCNINIAARFIETY